jgi:carboxyl-terminal processing protease
MRERGVLTHVIGSRRASISRALLLVIAVATAFTAGVTARQDWKTSALASFDDAWATIDASLYDPTAGGLDWNAVRVELRPKADAATSLDGVRAVITDMLGRLHRSHFVLLPAGGTASDPPMGEASVPIEFRITDPMIPGMIPGPKVVVTRANAGSSAERAGIRPGDVITRIDDVAVLAWFKDMAAAAPHVDERLVRLDMWRRVMRALSGPDGSSVALQFGHSDGQNVARVTREREAGEVVTLGNLPPLHVHIDHRLIDTPAKKHVGVIAFSIWFAQIDAPVAQAVDAYRHADGLVIDLRGNPGGLAIMMRNIAGQLVATPELLGTMHTRENTLTFKANPRLSTDDGRSVLPFAGPVALLVDDLTGSTSECFAAALQDLGRVRVFGRPTMGEALPARTKTLPDGDVLLYALGDFVTSKNRRVEGDGVIPDERIALTSEALRNGRDPDLAAALAWMDRGGAKRPN